jgi:hypothetical protein
MYRFLSRIVVGTVLGAGYIGHLASPPAQANPTTSPSARAAARLKHNPPRGWIRHYLGDDRYKILGGTWKVVSTELDQYYYPAWAPEMLRQPAGRVIGFPSAGAAEEAGYRRSNYPMDQPTLNASSADLRIATRTTSSTTVNRTTRAMRVVLADGRSTVLLPPNWRRTQSGTQTIAGRAALADTLQPVNGRGSIQFAFVNVPNNINIEPMLNANAFGRLLQMANSSGRVNNVQTNMLNSITVTDARLAGRSGVTITPRGQAAVPGLTGRTTVIARGSKAYVVVDNSQRAAGARNVIASFQPR